MRTTTLPSLLLTAALGLAACGDDPGGEGGDEPADPPGSGTASASAGDVERPEDLAIAESETREDTIYPDAGDPLVDALHYDLALAWTPEGEHLDATETLTFRATADGDTIPLDFTDALAISSLTVDGADAEFTQSDDDLVVDHPVTAGQQYVVELAYAGTPELAEAPTERPDFGGGVGWHITDDSEVWTLQEPYGAFTWFAVNDQPADKALYDFTLTVPEPWTGVANGELVSTEEADGLRTTVWHLAEPASSYLVCANFADYTVTEQTSGSGVPITLWVPTEAPEAAGDIDYAAEGMDWLEQYLGPYPFDTFGIVLNDGESGMETQTMVTLGSTAYSTSKAVVIHELAHQWYGNTVSPADWSEVWMNEGMAMYLQGMWEAEDEGVTIDEKMDDWAAFEGFERADAGPPADYDPTKFGAGNIYFGPALMWHELRQQIGDEEFFALVRAWPESQENDTADRDEYWSWIEAETGLELTAFFEDWLLGTETPERD